MPLSPIKFTAAIKLSTFGWNKLFPPPLYTYVRDKYACGNFGEIVAITIVIYSPRGRRICFPKSRNILERSRLTSNNFSTIFRFCKFGIEARMLIKSERSGWMIKRFRLTRILQGIIIFYSHINVNVVVEKFVNFDFKHFLNLEFNFSFPFRNLTSRNKFEFQFRSNFIAFVDLFISPSV